MNIGIISIVGIFLIGYFTSEIRSRIISYRKNINLMKDLNIQFSQILNNIKIGKSSFIRRTNFSVTIKTNIKDYGDINVLYLMDQNDLGIFKDNKCLYSSVGLNEDTKLEIIELINKIYKKNINDVVEFLGFIFSKEDFEKSLNINLTQIQKDQEKQLDYIKKIQDSQKSDIQKIIEENENKLDLDDILDKINKFGYNNLTKIEKEFLKKQKDI